MSNSYRLGKKSKYFGRENELISLWQDKSMTIDAISKLTRVSKRTLHKLFDPMGYDSKALLKIKGQQLADDNFRLKSQNLVSEITANPDFWYQAWLNQNLSKTVETYSKEHQVSRHVVLRLIQETYPNLKKRAPTVVQRAVSELTEADVTSFSQSTDKNAWLRKRFPQIKSIARLKTFIYQAYPDIRNHQATKRLKTMSDETVEPHALRLLLQGKTINEVALSLNVSHKFIKSIAVKHDVDTSSAVTQSYVRRSPIIANSLKHSTISAEQRLKRRHELAQVPNDYLGLVPSWLWAFIEKQPESLLVDKLYGIFTDKSRLVSLLNLAKNNNNGQTISWSQLQVYLPKIKGIDYWNKLASVFFAHDCDITTLVSSQSSYELMVNDYLKSLNVNFIVHDRSLGFELDFYLPNERIAIEVSPIATHHSNEYKHFGMSTYTPKTKSYHNHKFKVTEKHGIKLITLFEKQLDPEIWLSKTIPLLKRLILGHAERTFYARETNVIPMETLRDKQRARTFLNKYHMDGANRARYYLGMFLKKTNELVGVASFIPYTKNKKSTTSYELKRMAFATNVQVRFGISKFIKTFERLYALPNTSLITFSNNNMGNGSGYRNAGFEKIDETVAQLTFVNPYDINDTYSWQIATPWSAQQGVIAHLLGSQQLTTKQARRVVETELPHRGDSRVGYVAQYDAGNYKWIYYFKERK